MTAERFYPEVEQRLLPLARPLPRPQLGDWLAEHAEPGQDFAEYLAEHPIRRGERRDTIYLCLVGDFTKAQRQVLQLTREYLKRFFDAPVEVAERVPLSSIPPEAQRVHPSWGDRQILTRYILREVLLPMRPTNALAYLAFTASDLYPGEDWNFVFGQANLKQRIGVWSIYRNGDPSLHADRFRLCLRRTAAVAAHETGHILTMWHCTAFACLMNGSNHRAELDRQPSHLCPVCLRKLCWNLQVEPVPYLKSLGDFWRRHGFPDLADWHDTAVALLAG